MAHFALLDENNIVLRVEVISNDVAVDEDTGIEFLQSLYGGGNFKQCSYSSTIRKNFPGIGYSYDSTLDAFIPPKVYPSWKLNEETCLWEPPIKFPSKGKNYVWDENIISWVKVSELG